MMDRIQELKLFNILDTEPEQELDELAQIAASIFDTPVALITFMDENRQWYKAKIGVKREEVPLKESFCQFLLDENIKNLVVEDPFVDNRFKDYPNVVCENGIKFYASVPLVSKLGNVLGSVCILDYKSRSDFSMTKLGALDLIARRLMLYIETRKLVYQQNQEIEFNAERLKKLTDLVPGAIFKLSIGKTGELKFVFLSEGINNLAPGISKEDLKKNPRKLLDFIAAESREKIEFLFKSSFKDLNLINFEYIYEGPTKNKLWHWMRARPERKSENEVIWYGIILDITQKVNHKEALEKMLFDISHVLRKPVANIKGIVDVLLEEDLTSEERESYCAVIFSAVEELDGYIHQLNQEYFSLKSLLNKKWGLS